MLLTHIKSTITIYLAFCFNAIFFFSLPGERPYKCHLPECGRAFIQLSNLQQHLRNHDSQMERAKNRPFHCNICGKGFASESSLRTHRSKVSKQIFLYKFSIYLSWIFYLMIWPISVMTSSPAFIFSLSFLTKPPKASLHGSVQNRFKLASL